MRVKVEKQSSDAEELVVVLKLLQWQWSEGVLLSTLQQLINQKWEDL
jgi:hypothetical protein